LEHIKGSHLRAFLLRKNFTARCTFVQLRVSLSGEVFPFQEIFPIPVGLIVLHRLTNLFAHAKSPMFSLGTFKFIGIKSRAYVLGFYDLSFFCTASGEPFSEVRVLGMWNLYIVLIFTNNNLKR